MQILAKLFLKAGFKLGKIAYEKISEEPVLSKAITATVEYFPEVEVHFPLSKWCASDDFQKILARINRGDELLTNEEIVQSFIENGVFYVEDGLDSLATEVLSVFAERYREEALRSKEGVLFLANENRAAKEKILSAIEGSRQSTDDKLDLLLANVTQLSQKGLLADSQDDEHILKEKLLNARIDSVRDLLKDRRPLFAQHLLQEIRKEVESNSPSPELLFRLANNLGVCALQLRDPETAKGEFRLALSLKPDNLLALGNAAMAAFLADDLDQARELSVRVRQLEPRHSQATSVYLQILYRAGQHEGIKRLLDTDPWIGDDPACSLALGLINFVQEHYDTAEDYLRRSIKGDESEPQAYTFLGLTIYEPILRQLQDDPPLPWMMRAEINTRLEEAEAATNRAIELLESRDIREQLHVALTNRAQIRATLGQTDEAIKDCDRVLLENENHDLALRIKGVLLLKLGKSREAIVNFEKIKDDEHRTGIIYHLGFAYTDDNQPQKAIELLEPKWHPVADDRSQIIYAQALLTAYAKVGSTKKSAADEIERSLRTIWPEDSEARATIARKLRDENQFNEAENILIETLAKATGNKRDWIALELADLYYGQKRWAEAVGLLRPVLNLKADIARLRAFAISLFYAGEHQEALDLARAIRNGGEPIPGISAVEAAVLEHVDDLSPALELRLKLSQIDSKDPAHLIQAFMHAYRLGREEFARELIERIRYEDIKDNPWALCHVAEGRALFGMEGAIPLAYKARKLGFKIPEIHLAYLRVFSCREDPEAAELRPTEVALGCTVFLRSNQGEEEIYTITDEEPPGPNELAPTDSLAPKLMGKRPGETIVLREGPLETLSYEVLEIKSKYVHAFQETFLKFSTWFPDNPNLYRTKIDNNDFSAMFMMIDRRYAHVSFVMDMYRQNRLPLGMFARFVKTSRVDAWGEMASNPEGKIFAAQGTTADIEGEISKDRIVLDLGGLLTAYYLGILDRLPEVFSEIYVPQAVVDELSQELVNDQVSGRAKWTMGREQTRYTYQEVTENAREARRSLLQHFRDFIQSKTKVVPITTALTTDKEKYDKYRDIVGDGATASIIVASELDALLYSDDLGLSSIARDEWEVDSIWSQTVLSNMRKRGLLSGEEYQEGIRKLLAGNYHFVAFTIDDIKWIVRKNNWSITKEVMRVMRYLEGPDCDEGWAIEAISELIKHSYLEAAHSHQTDLFLDYALRVLTTGRRVRQVLPKVKVRVAVKLDLAPLHLESALHSINLWERASKRGQGLST